MIQINIFKIIIMKLTYNNIFIPLIVLQILLINNKLINLLDIILFILVKEYKETNVVGKINDCQNLINFIFNIIYTKFRKKIVMCI